MSKATTKRLPLCDAMVLAYMAGRKTQTRRIATAISRLAEGHRGVKVREKNGVFHLTRWPITWDYHVAPKRHWLERFEVLPRYAVGDRVVLTEAFRVIRRHGAPGALVEYRADKAARGRVIPDTHWDAPASQVRKTFLAARYMPLWAARNHAVITRVRCERVQDIFADEYSWDVFHEGICAVCDHCGTSYSDDPLEPPEVCGGHGGIGCHVDSAVLFRELWDSLHARDGHDWAQNPWVFAYTFEREERHDDT